MYHIANSGQCSVVPAKVSNRNRQGAWQYRREVPAGQIGVTTFGRSLVSPARRPAWSLPVIGRVWPLPGIRRCASQEHWPVEGYRASVPRNAPHDSVAVHIGNVQECTFKTAVVSACT